MNPKRKEYLRNYKREWVRKRRYEYFKDKRCNVCGTRENLELDHIEPSLKVSHNVWSWSGERRLAELAKCRYSVENTTRPKQQPTDANMLSSTYTVLTKPTTTGLVVYS